MLYCEQKFAVKKRIWAMPSRYAYILKYNAWPDTRALRMQDEVALSTVEKNFIKMSNSIHHVMPLTNLAKTNPYSAQNVIQNYLV
jgi:hypothetical protein